MTDVGKVGLLMLWAIPAAAQAIVGAQAGVIQFAEGDVTLDSRPVRVSENEFPVWENGQVLRTGRGRVELLLAPAVFLRIGSQGSVRMENAGLDDTRVELRKGTALIEVVEAMKGGRITLEQGETRTRFKGRGLYRFDAERHELRVFGGEAEVVAGEKKMSAGRGRAVQLNSSLVSSKFNPKSVDGLFQWAGRRSFYWFGSSPEEWMHRTDWEITITGWFWNRNFDLKFFSKPLASEFRQRQARDERQKALFDRLKEYDPQ